MWQVQWRRSSSARPNLYSIRSGEAELQPLTVCTRHFRPSRSTRILTVTQLLGQTEVQVRRAHDSSVLTSSVKPARIPIGSVGTHLRPSRNLGDVGQTVILSQFFSRAKLPVGRGGRAGVQAHRHRRLGQAEAAFQEDSCFGHAES